MATGLKFYTTSTRDVEASLDLSDAKVVVYEDGNGNKYILDASNIPSLNTIDDIKLSTLRNVVFKYHPNNGSETIETGLGSIIGTLLATEGSQNGTSVLAAKIAEPDVVTALVPALTAGAGDKGVYTKTEADTAFAKVDGSNATNQGVTDMLSKLPQDNQVIRTKELPAKVSHKDVVDVLVPELAAGNDAFAKVDGSNATNQGVTTMLSKLPQDNQVVRTQDLPAKVSHKDVVTALVPELVPALAKGVDNKGIYTKKGVDDAFVRNDGSNAGAIVTALTGDQDFINAAKIQANAEDAGFQSAVRGVISQPYFDIPADDSTPISAYW